MRMNTREDNTRKRILNTREKGKLNIKVVLNTRERLYNRG